MCSERTNGYYAAARGAAQRFHGSSRHIEEGASHGGERPVECLSVDMTEMPAVGKAGVADDLVEATEAIECRIHDQFACTTLGQICINSFDDGTAVPQLVSNLLQPRAVATVAAAPGVDQQLVPRCGNPAANCSANTARCTRNQCRQFAHECVALSRLKIFLDYRSWSRRSQRAKLTTTLELL